MSCDAPYMEHFRNWQEKDGHRREMHGCVRWILAHDFRRTRFCYYEVFKYRQEVVYHKIHTMYTPLDCIKGANIDYYKLKKCSESAGYNESMGMVHLEEPGSISSGGSWATADHKRHCFTLCKTDCSLQNRGNSFGHLLYDTC